MTTADPGWYDDGSGSRRWWDGQKWTDATQASTSAAGPGALVDRIRAEAAAGGAPRPAANGQAALGYRLHTITTAASGSKGIGGGDRIQATMVFERIV